jgi:hypothetical protein
MQNKEEIRYVVISSMITYTVWQESNETNITRMMPRAIGLFTISFHIVPGNK